MSKNILLTAIIATLTFTLNATTFFVSPGMTGKGLSWEDASGDLAAVLFAANYGDEVWVAAGTYYASYDNDRTRAFIVSKGVKVLGGFTGTETSADQRNPQNNKVILSGNIGDRESDLDNSNTVVIIGAADENTVLDGFSIADGTANSAGATAAPSRSGGGLYIMAKNSASTPVIRNCTFYNNYSRDGGAVYNNGKGGNASPTFENCQFYSNRSDLDGGAVFNDGRHEGNSSPIFKNCEFKGNEGNYGGAICNYGGRGKANPTIEGCTFANNDSYVNGDTCYNMDVEGEAAPMMINCNILDSKEMKDRNTMSARK
jgi:hypothetical protein